MKYLSVYSALIPAFLFVYFSSRNKLKEMQVLFVYVVLSFTNDQLLMSHPYKTYPVFTFIAYSLFTVLEYSLFSVFLFMVIKNKYFKTTIIGVSVLFLLFAFWFMYATWFIFDANTQKQFDSLPASVESILIIVFSILFLFDQLNNTDVIVIYESHRFWVITAFLIYMAGELFLFIYADSFTKAQKEYYWNILYSNNTVRNIIMSFAFVMQKNTINIYPSSLQKSYNI